MKRLFTLTLLSVLLSAVAAAQSLPNSTRRYINSKVLTLIEDYERFSSLYDEETKHDFLSLFEHTAAPVCCDMIGAEKYMQQLPVEEYVNCLTENCAFVSTVIKNVKKGEMTWTGGYWMIPVTFQKEFSFIDINDYSFSVKEYHGTEIQMTMNICYDPDTDLCFITSIDGALDSERQFPKGRFLIVNKREPESKKDAKFLASFNINGNFPVYDAFGAAILPAGAPSVEDIDVVGEADTLVKGFNYDVVKFSFDRRSARMKLRYAYAPFYAYDIKAAGADAVSSAAMELGIDFGGTWSMGKNTKMGIYAGLGLSASRMTVSSDGADYSYVISVTNGGLFKDKEIAYAGVSATEGFGFTDLIVPVYFELEHKMGKSLLLSWNVGAKGYYNMKVMNYSYAVSGLMNGNAFSLTQDNGFLAPANYIRDSFDVTFIANLGLDINLSKNKTYLTIRGGYEQELTSPFKNDGMPYMDAENGMYPVIYGGGENIAVQSFLSNMEYRRKAVWFELGIKFKM